MITYYGYTIDPHGTLRFEQVPQVRPARPVFDLCFPGGDADGDHVFVTNISIGVDSQLFREEGTEPIKISAHCFRPDPPVRIGLGAVLVGQAFSIEMENISYRPVDLLVMFAWHELEPASQTMVDRLMREFKKQPRRPR